MKVKEESEKAGLKLNIQKTKIVASSLITSWLIDGEAVRGLQPKIKRRLLLGRKAMTNLDSILKSRDITLPTKVWIVKPVVFPIVVYGCDNWTTKKAERQRIDAFELWCWRRLLRVPWITRRSNQSVLKEISPEYSLEGLMLKLKRWPPDVKDWLTGKDSNPGKDWRQEERGRTKDKMVGWSNTNSMDMSLYASSGSWRWTGKPGMLQSMGSQKVRHDWVTELNWSQLLMRREKC